MYFFCAWIFIIEAFCFFPVLSPLCPVLIFQLQWEDSLFLNKIMTLRCSSAELCFSSLFGLGALTLPVPFNLLSAQDITQSLPYMDKLIMTKMLINYRNITLLWFVFSNWDVVGGCEWCFIWKYFFIITTVLKLVNHVDRVCFFLLVFFVFFTR